MFLIIQYFTTNVKGHGMQCSNYESAYESSLLFFKGAVFIIFIIILSLFYFLTFSSCCLANIYVQLMSYKYILIKCAGYMDRYINSIN